ncbi:MAG: type 4a pilus biogenesis protein PilO [Patescibacteria group bacterium]
MKLMVGQKLGGFLPLFAMLIAILTIWFGLVPQFGRIGDTQSEIARLSGEVLAKTREVETLRKLLINSKATNGTLNLLSLAVPSEPQIPELLIMVQAVAQKAGLTLVNATPSASPGGTKMDITLKGGYSGVVSFLDILNRNLRPGVVQNFSIISQSNPPDESGSGLAQTVASLSVEFIGGAAAKEGGR